MINHIDKLAEAGVTSLKIEGRAKSAYYVAVITNAYRMAVDWHKKHLVNRFLTGFQKRFLKLVIENIVLDSFWTPQRLSVL